MTDAAAGRPDQVDPADLASPLGDGGPADCVVIGAGVMGAWTAWWAAQAGRRTVLIDAYGAGHPRATSGDETRIIRASHGDDPLYAEWSRTALDRWRMLEAASGERLFVQAGALWFARREDGFEAASLSTLTTLQVPIERLSGSEVMARWPQVAMRDGEWAAHEPEAGLLLARHGVSTIVRTYAAHGGRYAVAAVRPGRADGRRLADVVDGSGRRQVGETFVFACGPWLPRLFPEVLGPLIRVTKQDVVFLGPRGGDTRFRAGRFPCWVDYDVGMYGIPAVGERGVKLAPDRAGPLFDPSSGERVVDPESIRLARTYAARRFPDLAGAPVVETRVCQYETTPDTQFIIDRHPDFDNVWLVGGGSGHGYKHGPVIGSYVAERLDDGPSGPETARFGLDRPRTTDLALRTGADRGGPDWDGY